MIKLRTHRRGLFLSLATILIAGGALAVGMLSGLTIGMNLQTTADGDFEIPAELFDASATHGIDNYAICTGLLDDKTEAIFFLDFLTGELKGAAINRATTQFAALYKREILADFEGEGYDPGALKNPRFLMVTGVNKTQQSSRGGRIGRTLIYVMEVNSGKVIAYGVPEATAARSGGDAQQYTFTPKASLTLRRKGRVRPGQE